MDAMCWSYKYSVLVRALLGCVVVILVGLIALYGSDEGFHFEIDIIEKWRASFGPDVWRPFADAVNSHFPFLLPISGVVLLFLGLLTLFLIVRLLKDRMSINDSQLKINEREIIFTDIWSRKLHIKWCDFAGVELIKIRNYTFLTLINSSGKSIYIRPSHFTNLNIDCLYSLLVEKVQKN